MVEKQIYDEPMYFVCVPLARTLFVPFWLSVTERKARLRPILSAAAATTTSSPTCAAFRYLSQEIVVGTSSEKMYHQYYVMLKLTETPGTLLWWVSRARVEIESTRLAVNPPWRSPATLVCSGSTRNSARHQPSPAPTTCTWGAVRLIQNYISLFET